MGWNNITANQAVSGANLQDAGFILKAGQVIPNTSKCLTKSEAYALLEIELISGNELVVKSELVSSSVSPGYYMAADFSVASDVSGTDACALDPQESNTELYTANES